MFNIIFLGGLRRVSPARDFSSGAGGTKGFQPLVTAPVSRRGAGAAERARLEIA